jgi:hypothetical protein
MLRNKPKQMRKLEAGLRALGFTLHQARALLMLRLEMGRRLTPALIPYTDHPVRDRMDGDDRY